VKAKRRWIVISRTPQSDMDLRNTGKHFDSPIRAYEYMMEVSANMVPPYSEGSCFRLYLGFEVILVEPLEGWW
jgi:hypothetical protein